ncbi:hypothetical protein DFJ43DRAFT_1036577 [Lentinula guzmanii]|uniref:Uncharacterized protein n=1 Tax=Lentinula guzmanii TaxID=2804957 RepID=A0AA38JUI3_9AGAR|nr:hypothetical protein DFJ43DRAFT_1036577 [Lentinula guzmanii]
MQMKIVQSVDLDLQWQLMSRKADAGRHRKETDLPFYSFKHDFVFASRGPESFRRSLFQIERVPQLSVRFSKIGTPDPTCEEKPSLAVIHLEIGRSFPIYCLYFGLVHYEHDLGDRQKDLCSPGYIWDASEAMYISQLGTWKRRAWRTRERSIRAWKRSQGHRCGNRRKDDKNVNGEERTFWGIDWCTDNWTTVFWVIDNVERRVTVFDQQRVARWEYSDTEQDGAH